MNKAQQLRKQFIKFLSDHGSDVIYVRADRTAECPFCNHDASSGEGASDCPHCLGTGSPVSLEKARMIIAKTRMLFRPDMDMPFGTNATADVKAYFVPESYPVNGDLVIEVSWSSEGEPVDIVHVYILESVENQRNDDVIVYFTAILELLDFKNKTLETALFGR